MVMKSGQKNPGGMLGLHYPSHTELTQHSIQNGQDHLELAVSTRKLSSHLEEMTVYKGLHRGKWLLGLEVSSWAAVNATIGNLECGFVAVPRPAAIDLAGGLGT